MIPTKGMFLCDAGEFNKRISSLNVTEKYDFKIRAVAADISTGARRSANSCKRNRNSTFNNTVVRSKHILPRVCFVWPRQERNLSHSVFAVLLFRQQVKLTNTWSQYTLYSHRRHRRDGTNLFGSNEPPANYRCAVSTTRSRWPVIQCTSFLSLLLCNNGLNIL